MCGVTPPTHRRLHFRVVCSKGTYIRSLAHDLGRALGSAAHLTALLRREAIGEYRVDGAWDVATLADQLHQQRMARAREFRATEAAAEGGQDVAAAAEQTQPAEAAA